jgi:hypothetical protein
MSPQTNYIVNKEVIVETLTLFIPYGQVTEIRALIRALGFPRSATIIGYFDDPTLAAKAIASHPQMKNADGIYFVLNPVKTALLARTANRLKDGKTGESTSDAHIIKRCWLPIDFDPVRPAGISSTNDEHRQALDRMKRVAAALTDEGWPQPIMADSGNGAHLLYHIDLPNDEDAKILIQRCLAALDVRFSDGQVKIDTSVYNAARIWKLYGTIARKGDDTPERPHRQARILDCPDARICVSDAQLQLLATQVPQDTQQREVHCSPQGDCMLDVGEWIAAHGLEVRSAGEYQNGGHIWRLVTCPWNSDHTDKSAYIIQFKSGAVAAGCHHNSCQGKKWCDLRPIYEPGCYDRPRQTTKNVATPSVELAPDTKNEKDKETQAQILIRLARTATFFRAPEGSLYARVPVGNHYETWPIGMKGGFRLWLSKTYHTQFDCPPNTTALAQAIEWCEGEARFSEAVQPVFTRIAEHKGALYIDIGDESWRAIEVTREDWHVVSVPPVAFIRPNAMKALPEPQRGGKIDELRRFINVANDDDWKLIVGWLIGAFHPNGPFPIACIHGERGAAKSSATRYLRNMVDPAWAPTRSAPKDDRDLAIAAHNSWVLALENLSHIPTWLSDGLCRIATGAGYATRALYEDVGETVFQARRPVILNGIEELATRGDLLDRAIIVTLPAIPDNVRQAEAILDRAFEEAHPRMFAGLLDVLVMALRNEATTQLDELPRMADFARWVIAAEPALGWKSGDFMRAYNENRAIAVDIEIEASPLATAIKDFIEVRDGDWQGTASDLYSALTAYAPENDEGKHSTLPRNARALSGSLKRIATALRANGIAVTWERDNEHRTIALRTFVVASSHTQKTGSGDAKVTQNGAKVTQNSPMASPPDTAFHQQMGRFGDASDAGDAKSSRSSIVVETEKKEGEEDNNGRVEHGRDFASPASFASQKAPVHNAEAHQAPSNSMPRITCVRHPDAPTEIQERGAFKDIKVLACSICHLAVDDSDRRAKR